MMLKLAAAAALAFAPLATARPTIGGLGRTLLGSAQQRAEVRYRAQRTAHVMLVLALQSGSWKSSWHSIDAELFALLFARSHGLAHVAFCCSGWRAALCNALPIVGHVGTRASWSQVAPHTRKLSKRVHGQDNHDTAA